MTSAPDPERDDGPGGGVPDDDLLAGEFVLGVLDAAERARVRERARAEATFAGRIEAWERRLAPWLEQVQPVPAPAHVWPRIRERLGWVEPRAAGGLWQNLLLWRSLAALAVVATVAVFIAQPTWQRPVRPAPPAAEEASLTKAVTLLTADDGRAAWLATVDPARGTVLMVPVPRAADAAGRVPELWIIPAGQAPRSLGAVSINRAHTVAVPADARAALGAPGSVLAITLEPSPGLPHPAPSGPVIAKGAVQT